MGETRQRKVEGKPASKKKEKATVNTEVDKSEQADGETKNTKKVNLFA